LSKINLLEKLGWGEEHIEEFRNAGYAYIRQGKYSTALPFFEALTILQPQSAYDVQTLGAIYVQLNEPTKAIKYLDRALQLEADHAPTLLNLCKTFFMMDKKQEGIKLAQVLAKDPNYFVSSTASALLMSHAQQ
jgi:predicted Zn-dependent protease